MDKNDDLLKYENITKDFDMLTLSRGEPKKMKIRYNNPEDIDKHLVVESSDDIISVKDRDMILEQKTSEYIRLTFHTPNTLGIYTSSVTVKDKNSGEIEEILRFHIKVR